MITNPEWLKPKEKPYASEEDYGKLQTQTRPDKYGMRER